MFHILFGWSWNWWWLWLVVSRDLFWQPWECGGWWGWWGCCSFCRCCWVGWCKRFGFGVVKELVEVFTRYVFFVWSCGSITMIVTVMKVLSIASRHHPYHMVPKCDSRSPSISIHQQSKHRHDTIDTWRTPSLLRQPKRRPQQSTSYATSTTSIHTITKRIKVSSYYSFYFSLHINNSLYTIPIINTYTIVSTIYYPLN